jgi:hypothetical protein
MPDACEFDVALSFAGENRKYVSEVAEHLKRRGVRVFYDGDQEATLWGKDLYTHLTEVYQHKARYAVLFASEFYARKVWPTHERRAAQARALTAAGEYILPARFDATEIPGVLPTTGYVDLHQKTPEQLADLVCEKLRLAGVAVGERQTQPHAAPSSPPPPPRRGVFRARMADDRIDRIMVPFAPPTGINIPDGYQPRLNHIAAEAARESAVRTERGYRYPVHVRGAEDDVNHFMVTVLVALGVDGVAHEAKDGEGEAWFEYEGATSPERACAPAVATGGPVRGDAHRLTIKREVAAADPRGRATAGQMCEGRGSPRL